MMTYSVALKLDHSDVLAIRLKSDRTEGDTCFGNAAGNFNFFTKTQGQATKSYHIVSTPAEALLSV